MWKWRERGRAFVRMDDSPARTRLWREHGDGIVLGIPRAAMAVSPSSSLCTVSTKLRHRPQDMSSLGATWSRYSDMEPSVVLLPRGKNRNRLFGCAPPTANSVSGERASHGPTRGTAHTMCDP